MLVLTRKIDQGIVVSGNIIIRVLGVERDRVKIGIAAPTEVTILRQELLDRGTVEGSNQSPAINDAPDATKPPEGFASGSPERH